MRKVTASAVILTALTGCSQSSVPSTQWSFEVPDGNQAVGVQRSSSESSFAEEISANALAGISQSNTGAMMGPAFDQPDSSAGLTNQTPLYNPNSLISGDLSSLVTTATNPRSNAFIQATARPDPIAQARSYLSRTSRPTSVISRVPYTSQVYLPSTPAAAPLSALGTVPTASIAPAVASPVSSSQISSNQTAVSQATVSQTTAPQSTPPQPLAAWTALPPAPVSTTPVAAVYAPEEIPSLYQEVNPAETMATTVPVVDDGLPVLVSNESIVAQASVTNASTAQAPVEIPIEATAIAADSDVSIGTSILQELQRNANGSEAATVSQPATQLVTNAATAPAAATQTVAVTSQSVGNPKLARLLAGLPLREQSSEIASFRQPTAAVATEAVSVEAVSVAESERQAVVYSTESNESASSPLLEGLTDSGETVTSTIYVPIPNAVDIDTSATFIQSAIAALEKEASAIAFDNSALPNPESALSVESLDAVPSEAISLEIELQEMTLQDADLQDADLQDSDRLARLLSLIRVPHSVPSLAQDGEALPAEIAVEDNIQASAVNLIQSAQRDRSPAAVHLAKQPVRKYRQRISWNNATI